MTSTDPTVTLATSDNQTRQVSWHVFKRFGLFSPQDDPEMRPQEVVPLPNVASAVLEKVIDYCEHHRNDPCPDPESSDDPRKRVVSEIGEWDQQFIQVDQEMLFEIILAANYLDIKPLLEVGTKTVANMMKGKSPEEIRRMFNIVDDFTPEEEAQIKKENEWAEDV